MSTTTKSKTYKGGKKVAPKHSKTKYGYAIMRGQKRIERAREAQRTLLKKAGKFHR